MVNTSSRLAAQLRLVAQWRPGEAVLTALLAWYFTTFANGSLVRALAAAYPLSAGGSGVAVWIAVYAVLYAITLLCLTLLLWPAWFRMGATLLAVATAVAAWAMDTWHVILHPDVIRSVLATDRAEVRDLLQPALAGEIVLLAVPPIVCVWLWRAPDYRSAGALIWSKTGLAGIAFALLGGVYAASPQGVAAFVREHKTIREFANPGMYLYSLARTLLSDGEASLQEAEPRVIGTDARIAHAADAARLVVLVVGETARPDHMSIYGYPRPTTPTLAGQRIVALTRVEACGTSTAVSLPCMFSDLPRHGHDVGDWRGRENLLDVLTRAGVRVLWRDNNSDSKGVAMRVRYEDFRSPRLNPECDLECRDIGMLAGLDDYIARNAGADLLIVLHQRGSHGPAYWHRVPDGARAFVPGCHTSDLQHCTHEEIVNAYDDTIRQTDRFLGATIDLLERHGEYAHSALVYVGDHGESLGEHGWYLHGMPRALAPREQLAVPWVFWFGPGFAGLEQRLVARRAASLSHDNLFHAMLRLMDVDTALYDPALDPFGART